MRTFALSLSVTLLLLAMRAEKLAGQTDDQCNAITIPNAEGLGELTYLKGPFFFQCSSGAELRADSGVANRLSGEIVLIGNVSYVDSARSLTASQATYTRPIRRLYATGDVVFINRTEGMSIRGPTLEYFATMPERPLSQVNASGRPHLTLRPRGADPDDEPMEIDADLINIQGDDDLSAFGAVMITRTDLEASADEARYQGASENLELRESAVVRSKDSTLSGRVIQAQLENDQLSEVRARTDARLESEDMTVTAPDVQMFFENELIQRTIARIAEGDSSGGRAVVRSRTFRLEADSIEALAPDQVLEQVTAVGGAHGESIDTTTSGMAAASARADSVAARAARGDTTTVTVADADSTESDATPGHDLVAKDWLKGDTIVGYFIPSDSVLEGDSTNVELRLLVATGRAQSLYRIEEQGEGATPTATAGRPGINFASAEKISLAFEEGKIGHVELTGVKRGIYLDPSGQTQPITAPPAGLAPIPAGSPAGLPPVPTGTPAGLPPVPEE